MEFVVVSAQFHWKLNTATQKHSFFMKVHMNTTDMRHEMLWQQKFQFQVHKAENHFDMTMKVEVRGINSITSISWRDHKTCEVYLAVAEKAKVGIEYNRIFSLKTDMSEPLVTFGECVEMKIDWLDIRFFSRASRGQILRNQVLASQRC